METSRISKLEQIQAEQPVPEPDAATQDDEILAWEPVGDDLWLPHRIRGSWRGGVLG
jgi:hypothetical protein